MYRFGSSCAYPFGKVISVTNFPSLDNDADLISLFSATGKTIHAVQYTSAWYQNELKKDGGWTLEMIDTKNPCSGISNWKASLMQTGVLPAKKIQLMVLIMMKQHPNFYGLLQ